MLPIRFNAQAVDDVGELVDPVAVVAVSHFLSAFFCGSPESQAAGRAQILWKKTQKTCNLGGLIFHTYKQAKITKQPSNQPNTQIKLYMVGGWVSVGGFVAINRPFFCAHVFPSFMYSSGYVCARFVCADDVQQ